MPCATSWQGNRENLLLVITLFDLENADIISCLQQQKKVQTLCTKIPLYYQIGTIRPGSVLSNCMIHSLNPGLSQSRGVPLLVQSSPLHNDPFHEPACRAKACVVNRENSQFLKGCRIPFIDCCAKAGASMRAGYVWQPDRLLHWIKSPHNREPE